jgi:hypothetical protein
MRIKGLLILFLIFFFSLLLLPRFDGKTFYSFLSSNNSVPFSDAKSDIVIWTFLKFKEGDLCFREGEQFNSLIVGENVDLVKVENSECYAPTPSVFAVFLFLFPFGMLSSTIIGLAKFLVVGNMIYAGLGLVFFYLILKVLDIKHSFVFTLIAGFCTGWFIYSFSLLSEIIYTTILLGCVYFAISFYKLEKDKFFFLFSLFFFLLIFALPYTLGDKLPFPKALTHFVVRFFSYALVLTLPLIIFLFVTGRITRNKLFFLGVLYFFAGFLYDFVLYPYMSEGSVWSSEYYFVADANPGAISAELFGYTTSNRVHSFLYSFKDKANGLFLNSYGLFGSLFSEKGFVYNSPFLIFGFIGLIFFKPKNLRNILLMILIINLAVSVLSSTWHGGSTPRYVRHYLPAVFILSIFAFDYVQKNKNLFVKLLFAGLVLLSFLNVLSLAVRLDWSYENPNDLVSYDYVLFPMLSSGLSYNTSFCPTIYENTGWVLDVCNCASSSHSLLTRPEGDFFVFACAKFAGGDGLFLNYSYNNFSDAHYLEPNNCAVFNVNSNSDVNFWVERFGECDAEMVGIKFSDM